MARSGATYHQDYIARIRYSNVLPPPPNPPKLLDIPGTGMSGGQYTSAGYASRLAREQELNIEADGELGMPIDLVGIPGVFDGDESAIYGLDHPPPPHPHDKPLLRPIAMLGKPAGVSTGVSFLRRTEYISSDAGRVKVDSTPLRSKHLPKKRKASGIDRDDDPVRMLRGIYKGFDTAYPDDAYKGPDTTEQLRGDAVTSQDATAWETPKHPTDPDLKPLDTYPILPDLDAFPDSGNFFVVKFTTNPVADSDTYDKRLDIALLKPIEPFPGAVEACNQQKEAYAADPTLPVPKPVDFNYTLFLPKDSDPVSSIAAVFDTTNEHKDDESLYPEGDAETGRRSFRFQNQRLYETYNQSGNQEDVWGESVAVALHDSSSGDGRTLQKAAYIYPILQRAIIRPKRKANMGAMSSQVEDEEHIDFLDVAVREPLEDEAEKRQGHREDLLKVKLQEPSSQGLPNGLEDAVGSPVAMES